MCNVTRLPTRYLQNPATALALSTCPCQEGYIGTYCNTCQLNVAYIVTVANHPSSDVASVIHPIRCQLCQCDKTGSEGSGCKSYTGQCQCRPGFTGPQCNRCKPGAGHFPFCTAGCDCHEQGTRRCLNRLNVCECHEGFMGSKCNLCADGYTGYPDCQGVFVKQNITGFTIVGMFVIIGMILLCCSKRSPLLSHRNEPLARLISVVNTGMEIFFIVHVQPGQHKYSLYLIIAGSVIMCVSCLLYGLLLWCIIRRERGSNISFHAWLDYYAKVTWFTSILAMITGPAQMLLLQSRIHRHPALSAPMRDITINQLRAAGLLGVLVHTPMMLALQILTIFMLGRNKTDLVTVVAIGLGMVTFLIYVILDYDRIRYTRKIFTSTSMFPDPDVLGKGMRGGNKPLGHATTPN
ncbi:hypothetical protein BDF22DRAFT_91744 [Syncephalis plumigaleata]|nr:hypothetical protein BDF22DRAFT_91744 [Syncephalis plumigaleata]